MRILTASIVTLVLCAMTAPLALAQDGDKGDRAERRKKAIEKFDKDGDGKLNEEERAAAKEARQKRGGKKGQGQAKQGRRGGRGQAGRGQRMTREQALAKYDADKDGQLDKDEKAKMQADMRKRRAEMLKKRFDKDGDGKLNADEKAAKDEFLANMEKRRKEMMTKYDADGDGKLSKEERQKMAADRPARDGKKGKKGGKKSNKNKPEA